MDKNKIYHFPILSEDLVVKELRETIQTAEKGLANRIVVLQLGCTHDLKKIYEYPNKVFDSDKGAVIAKECTKCGITIQKPKGTDWEICEICWSKMEYKGREPGQGGGTHHYKCTVCCHQHTHT